MMRQFAFTVTDQYPFNFLREIANLQERPQEVTSAAIVKNLNKISRLSEVPNAL